MDPKLERGVEVVAAPIITNNEGEILLIKSPKWGDIWLIPGGHVEPGETVFQAAEREGEEETGLKLKALYCVNVGELINDPSFHRPAHLMYFHIVCKAESGYLQLDARELSDAKWIKPKDALLLNVTESVKETIQFFIGEKRVNISTHVF